MIDTETPNTAGWWLRTLARHLTDRRLGRAGGQRWNRQSTRANRMRPPVELLDDYRRGDPPLNSVASEWRPHLREFMRMGRLHVADVLVTSTSHRMQLRGFRTAAADDELGDVRAQDIMTANDLALASRDVHEGMLGLADSYTIIAPPDPDHGRDYPLITAEDASQVITAHDPATGATLAALKLFRDEWDSADFAYVFLPGKVYVAAKRGTSSITGSPFRMSNTWEWDDEREQDVPGNRVPVVRFRNRNGVGEFEQHLGSLDRINEKIANEWWIGKIQAHRQRAVEIPDADDIGGDDDEDDYDDVFVADPGAMWKVPQGTKFWESQPVNLDPVINSIKQDLVRLAFVTSTPLHIVTPDAAAGSAEGAALLREEHVFKVEDRRDRTGGPWAETMSIAFAFLGDTERGDRRQITPIWGPVERYSLAQKGSAVAQMWGKLPSEAIYTDVLQYPPAEIPNLRQLRGRDLLFQQPNQPPTTGP